MPNIFNAVTTGVGGVSVAADTSGSFAFAKDGSNLATLSASGTMTATAFSGDGSALTGIVAVPAGTIILYAGTTAPSGYLVCPTSLTNISRTTYAALFAAIGTTWGSGDGSTTFGLPWFAADYTTIQANSNVGTATTGQMPSHTHNTTVRSDVISPAGSNNLQGSNASGSFATYATAAAGSGSATLAAGARVLHCIKF